MVKLKEQYTKELTNEIAHLIHNKNQAYAKQYGDMDAVSDPEWAIQENVPQFESNEEIISKHIQNMLDELSLCKEDSYKIRPYNTRIIVTMETCEDHLKTTETFESRKDLYDFLENRYNPYVYSITDVEEITQFGYPSIDF